MSWHVLWGTFTGTDWDDDDCSEGSITQILKDYIVINWRLLQA